MFQLSSIEIPEATLDRGSSMVVVTSSKYYLVKVFSDSTMGGVIHRLGTRPEPCESENTSEDLHRS